MRAILALGLLVAVGCVKLPSPETFARTPPSTSTSTARGCAVAGCIRAGAPAAPSALPDDCAPATRADAVVVTAPGGESLPFVPRSLRTTWETTDFGCAPTLHVVLMETPGCTPGVAGQLDVALDGTRLRSGALLGSTDLAQLDAGAAVTLDQLGVRLGRPLEGSSLTLTTAAGGTLTGSIDAMLLGGSGLAPVPAHVVAHFAVSPPRAPPCAI